MSSEKLPPSRLRIGSAEDAAQRLATIVDAAERAAASVIDGAEQEAQRYLEQARQRADRIVADRLRDLADQLDPPGGAEIEAVPEVEPEIEPELEIEPEPEVAPPPVRLQRVELNSDSDGAPRRLHTRRSGSAGARLLATQMAVSGASREEIEQRLRSGFEIDDTSEILDAILGPEG